MGELSLPEKRTKIIEAVRTLVAKRSGPVSIDELRAECAFLSGPDRANLHLMISPLVRRGLLVWAGSKDFVTLAPAKP